MSMLALATNSPPVDSAANSIHLSVLGGFFLAHASGRPITVANKKACGLLAYLCLSRSNAASRERLAGLFWSDSGEEQARASLRQTLKQLRKVFEEVGFDGFSTGRQDISLHAGRIAIDVDLISGNLESGELKSPPFGADNGPEKILYGYEGIDQSFAAWLHVVRQTWHDRFVDQLQTKLRDQHRDTAKFAAEALISIDSTHEEAYRQLIRHHADAGNTSAAIRQYNALWELLGDEYDMEPDQATQELIAAIKGGTYVGSTNPAVESKQTVIGQDNVADGQNAFPISRLPTIGIWNFVRADSNTQTNYLIEGFRRELIAALVRFREWVTVEGEDFAGSAPDPFNLENLPDYKLEGTYFEEEGSVRLIITLKDTATHAYVWSEQIELTLDNWVVTQRLIVRRIAIAFNVGLTANRLNRVSGSGPIERSAYDNWLKGQALIYGVRAADWEAATSVFKEIVEENSSFAPAYSSLAQLENQRHLAFPGVFRSKASQDAALKYARRAVGLDPLDTRSHLSLAWALMLNGKFDQANLSFNSATELNPNDPWTIVSAALGFAFSGDADRSRQLAAQALLLNSDPSKTQWAFQATLRFMCGDYEECIEAAENSESAISNIYGWKTAALAKIGRKEEASKCAAQFVEHISARWRGQSEVSAANIADWFLHCFPIKDRETWFALRDGLEVAGIAANCDPDKIFDQDPRSTD